MFIPKIVYTVFIISLGYFLALTVYYLILALVGSFENTKRTLEEVAEDYSLFYFSKFKIPVTLIVPAHNEEEWILDSLKSLLNLNYPEFEIIVVNDGSTDRTLDKLNEFLKLKPADIAYIKHYKGGKINQMLKSETYPNVTVINKESGHKKAGAANVGLNIAQYDYVCVMDADTILERDALLKVMAQVHKEPDKIIGAGSYFGLVNGFKVKDGTIVERNHSYNPIIAYQNIEYIRSFIGNRLAWSKYNAMPIVSGGFGIWRKDLLYELGGFSVEFTCEDMEFTFRAHDYIAKHKDKGYRIIMLPYSVGWTEGPSNIQSLILQRDRWQRVVDETIWRYKYMICNPKYGFFAFMTMPYFVLYEVLGVFAEIVSIAFVTFGWLIGALHLDVFLAYFLLMVLSQAFVSLISILVFVRGQRVFKIRYIMYLVGLALVEFFWYRWIISLAKLLGTWNFLKKKRSPDQYIRAKRIV